MAAPQNPPEVRLPGRKSVLSGKPLLYVARVFFFFVLLSTTDSCAPVSETGAPAASPQSTAISGTPLVVSFEGRSQIYALLADMRLLVVRPDGATLAVTNLGLAAPISSAGHYLALANDHQQVYVLASHQPQSLDQVVAVNALSTQVEGTYALPDGVYRSIAVGIQTGHLFVFGNRGGSTIITVVDPASGATLVTWTARPQDGHTWTVYQGAVSADEQRVYVSYHGPDTTGIDWFDVTGNGLIRCVSQEPANFGCIASHGGFTLFPDRLLAATGGPVILNMDRTGQVQEAFDTGLEGNHLMEFVADPMTERLYAVGSCGYTGGFSAVSLREAGILATPTLPGVWNWSIPPPPPHVLVKTQPCGERLSLGSDGLVIGMTAQPVPQPAKQGALLIVDPNTGRTIHQMELPSEPLDVLALPPVS